MAELTPEVDRNMVASEPDENGLVWYRVPAAPFTVYGAYSVNPYLRMPEDVAKATNGGVARNAWHTAGVRLRFATDSARIGVRAKMPYVTKYVHMALLASGSFDVYEDSDGGSRFLCAIKPAMDVTEGFCVTTSLGGKKKRALTVNFPLYSPVDCLEIGLDADATVAEGKKYRDMLPIVYYGSSITQGACASRPGLAYEAIISRRLNIDHVNLGFSGNAKGELPIAEYMAGLPMSCFVCDYDHNAPNAEYLRSTHQRLYEIIRAKNPDIPYIMISAPDFFNHEEDRTQRRAVVEDTLRYARANGDSHVYYIDGEGLYRGADEDDCTEDGVHPNDVGFLKMADAIERILVRALRRRAAEE